MIIKCKSIYTECGCVDGYLKIENGKIVDILSNTTTDFIDIDYADYKILPGIFDTHNHGTHGFSVMSEEVDEEEIKGYLKGLATQGVTSVLVTCDPKLIAKVVKVSKENYVGAKIAGIHCEGPYLNRVGEKGVSNGHPDIDINFVKKMVEDSEGLLKLVAIAPELPGSDEVIEYLTKHGVRCAFAHSNCNYEETLDAFKKGITVVTHTANVMSGIHHRQMGGLGACLLDQEVYNEVICDGLHVCNPMLEIMFKLKPLEKFMMISDNVPVASIPCGSYAVKGFLDVTVDKDGYCLSDTGRICGSTKSVLFGIMNLCKNLDMKLEEVSKMASLNPSVVYGMKNKGSIKIGLDADYIVIDENFEVIETVVEGNCIYKNDEPNPINQKFIGLYKMK